MKRTGIPTAALAIEGFMSFGHKQGKKDHEAVLGADPLRADVKRKAVRGAGVNLLSQVISILAQLVGTVVLARLLTPADFGLVAMVTTFSLLVMNVGYNGFTEAIIQREAINHRMMSSLFWFNASISLLLTALFMSSAPLIAAFYDETSVTAITLGMSLSICSCGFSTVHNALLMRQMRFHATAAISIVSRGLSVVLSIVLAWMGWGAWALVAGIVAQHVITAIGSWLLCSWRPGMPGRHTGIKPMVTFALHAYGNFALNYASRNIDNLLVGWYHGSQSLGFYKKAYDLFALPAGLLTSQMTGVAIAAMSRLTGEPAEYRRAYLNAVSIIAFVGMPLSAFFVITGHDLIILVLGPQWVKSGEIFSYFGLGMGVMLIYATHGWIHLSLGRADRWLRWGVVELATTAALFILALPHGPAWIAVAWTVSFFFLVGPAISYAGKPIDLGFSSVVRVAWRAFLSAMIAGFLTGAALRHAGLPFSTHSVFDIIIRLITTGVPFTGLYLFLICVLHGTTQPIRQFIRILREMMPLSDSKRSSP